MLSFASSALNKLSAITLSSSSSSGGGGGGGGCRQGDHLPEFTLEQVSWHDTRSDCWVVVDDFIYNLTEMLTALRDGGHPGGDDVLLEQAGRDATIAFHSVGHSMDANRQMDRYLVGILPLHQRISHLRRNSA